MGKVDKQDSLLFRSTIARQAPVDKDNIDHTYSQRKPIFTEYSITHHGTIHGEEVVSYAKNSIPKKTFNKMKRGYFSNVPELDLHGYTLEQACQSLSKFIYHQQFKQFVRVIHGKGYGSSGNGMGVLKTQVISFLKQHPQVRAFHSCPPKDGGTGAVFVLLKQ